MLTSVENYFVFCKWIVIFVTLVHSCVFYAMLSNFVWKYWRFVGFNWNMRASLVQLTLALLTSAIDKCAFSKFWPEFPRRQIPMSQQWFRGWLILRITYFPWLLSWVFLSKVLTHWGRVTHICVGNLNITGSDNGLSPGRRQAIIWTSAGILLIGPVGTNFSEIVIKIYTFS